MPRFSPGADRLSDRADSAGSYALGRRRPTRRRAATAQHDGMKRTGPVIVGTLLLAAIAGVAALEYAGWPGLAPRLAARGGYNPYGLVGVLQTLSEAPNDGNLALMFKTHPSPADRLDQLGAAMGERLDDVGSTVDDVPRFARMKR